MFLIKKQILYVKIQYRILKRSLIRHKQGNKITQNSGNFEKSKQVCIRIESFVIVTFLLFYRKNIKVSFSFLFLSSFVLKIFCYSLLKANNCFHFDKTFDPMAL